MVDFYHFTRDGKAANLLAGDEADAVRVLNERFAGQPQLKSSGGEYLQLRQRLEALLRAEAAKKLSVPDMVDHPLYFKSVEGSDPDWHGQIKLKIAPELLTSSTFSVGDSFDHLRRLGAQKGERVRKLTNLDLKKLRKIIAGNDVVIDDLAGLQQLVVPMERPLAGNYVEGRLWAPWEVVGDTVVPLKKTAISSALGLPDRSDYGSPEELTVGDLVPWVVQEHDAKRAGKHYDIRLGKERMLSWASRKGLPDPGTPRLATEQPIHAEPYMHFQGTLPTGYGAGTVRTADKGKVLVTKADPGHVQVVIAHKKSPRRLNFIRTQDGHWLLSDSTPQAPIVNEKGKYKQLSPEEADALFDDENNQVTPKIDGAGGVYDVSPKRVEAYSTRTGVDGKPIVHTERLGLSGLSAKTKARLRGEIYGVDETGKAIPPQELGGLLSSTLENTIRDRLKRKIQLKNLIFNISSFGGKPVPEDLPYLDRLELARKALEGLPTDKFQLAEPVTGESARKMLKEILAGQNPLTDEGVVINTPHGTFKVKNRPEFDVMAREVYPGTRPGMYGGFRYSLQPDSAIVGNVGTGLSDDTRRRLQEYVGRWAKIKAQGQFPSGAYRAPSLIAFHEDKA